MREENEICYGLLWTKKAHMSVLGDSKDHDRNTVQVTSGNARSSHQAELESTPPRDLRSASMHIKLASLVSQSFE